ncbi:MAG: hypothetical protein AAF586_05720, partial [Planctomycetota bacterium]
EPATASSGDAAGAAAVSDEQMLAAVLERMPVSEASLLELANARAEAVVAALMSGEEPIDASRVTATEPEAGEMAVTFSLE